MKKLILSLLFIFCFYIKAQATSWMYLWDESTTTIEIPLGGNLQNYISIPKATLYKDGVALMDAQISYTSTGDWLYLLTDVDTNIVGTYPVWYKAVENKYRPGQCQGYKTLVTFIVVDKEKPYFEDCPTEITYWIGATKPNYLSQIIAKDNSGSCLVSVDDSLVNYDKPGEYVAIARASDGSFITEQNIDVIVKDPVGPIITFLGENNRILLAKGDESSLQSYFKAVDKIDGDVTSSISYLPFDTDEEASFELEVSFFDKNGNTSSISVWIDIVDQDEIYIELYKTYLILEYNQNYEDALKTNIKSATLGKNNIKSEVEIDTSSMKNAVGSYVVTYSYRIDDKEYEIDCEVKMLSSQAPILLVENISVLLNEKATILDHIFVKDLSDPDIEHKIEYDASLVNYSKEGCYPVQVTVTNSSNLSSYETLYITVYSKSSLAIEEAKSGLFIPIIICVMIISGGVCAFLYFKKKRNCNKKENQL